MMPLAAAILTVLLRMPAEWVPPGAPPVETQAEREARMGVLAEAIATASVDLTCDQGSRPGCIRVWPGRTVDLAAMLVVQGRHESGFMLRIHAGRCRSNECDARVVRGVVVHRAATPWQLQVTGLVPATLWRTLTGTDYEATYRAAHAAGRVLASARAQCRRAKGSWEAATISHYATGNRCAWRGAALRVRHYVSVRHALSKSTAVSSPAAPAG